MRQAGVVGARAWPCSSVLEGRRRRAPSSCPRAAPRSFASRTSGSSLEVRVGEQRVDLRVEAVLLHELRRSSRPGWRSALRTGTPVGLGQDRVVRGLAAERAGPPP